MVFDVIIFSAIVIFTIIGYFKGLLSQLSSFVGIVLAFYFSPRWAGLISAPIRDLLPFSYVVSDMFSRLLIGILIFFAVKITGKFVEFLFVSKVRELSAVNRWGGLLFGFLKSVAVALIVMIFATLIPSEVVAKRFAFLEGSFTYKSVRKYNPVINAGVMDNIRKISDLTKDTKRLEILNASAVYRDFLKTRNIENPLGEESTIEKFQKGDVEGLKREGVFDLLKDKDFLDFIYGEKYYAAPVKEPPPAPAVKAK